MINPSQRSLPDNTQHSQQTNIHARGGIRTHSLSRRAAEDLRPRPRGHWDRQESYIKLENKDGGPYLLFYPKYASKISSNTESVFCRRNCFQFCFIGLYKNKCTKHGFLFALQVCVIKSQITVSQTISVWQSAHEHTRNRVAVISFKC